VKYLNALLEGPKKSHTPRGEEPTKPMKPVLSVSSGTDGRSAQKFEQALVPSWPCPQCNGRVRLELVDEHAPSRFWACAQCGAWGGTRDGATYPTVWVGSGAVQ
jgi:hypothetical protein